MYYLYDITSDYYDCETCLWNGDCDQLTIEMPPAAYHPSESGVRRSRAHITIGGCGHYTPVLEQEELTAASYYQRDLDERAAEYQRLINVYQ